MMIDEALAEVIPLPPEDEELMHAACDLALDKEYYEHVKATLYSDAIVLTIQVVFLSLRKLKISPTFVLILVSTSFSSCCERGKTNKRSK